MLVARYYVCICLCVVLIVGMHFIWDRLLFYSYDGDNVHVHTQDVFSAILNEYDVETNDRNYTTNPHDLQCNASNFLQARLHGIPVPNTSDLCTMPHVHYSATEACDVLSSYSEILLFGDSLCRHVSVAISSICRGDVQYGAMREWEVPGDLNCTGEMQYSEVACRLYTLTDSTVLQSVNQSLCANHKVIVRLLEWWQVGDVARFLGNPSYSEKDYVYGLSEIHPRTAMLIFPPGLHMDMTHPEDIISQYVNPLVQAGHNVNGTVIVLVGIHAMAPNMPEQYAYKQNKDIITAFNRHVQHYAVSNNIDYMDVYDMSIGHYSYDGVHYGLHVNVLKAQLLLNYLDLYRRGV